MIPKGKSKYSSDVSNVDVNIGSKLATGYFNDNADVLPRAVEETTTEVMPTASGLTFKMVRIKKCN